MLLDSQFSQFTLFPDRNAKDAALEDDPVLQVQYGQLVYILVLQLEPFPEAGSDFTRETTHRLACILPCKLLQHSDATKELVEYQEMQETPIFVHIGVVECAVGRIRTENGWVIIDRSGDFAWTVFTPDE